MPVERVRVQPVSQLVAQHMARRLARHAVQIWKLPEQALGHLGKRKALFIVHVTRLPDCGGHHYIRKP
ncbi:hypothetical protein PPTS312_01640 [Pseudomonas putida]|uniref:Uncharacterized protein n=1 Tax=Pseudomonas putida TaxID=303 RepID=A0A7U6LY69_PSEPU|nr:hypothetical protein PPTS312_01640 [Pseudomonas putida]